MSGKIFIEMIENEKIKELLDLPIEERRRVLRMLQESLTEGPESLGQSGKDDQPSPAAQWLLSRAGRYSSGRTNSAERADEIMLEEIDPRSGLTTKM